MSIRLPMDTRPLRDGRELRLLLGGRAISALGSAVTMVTAALQDYRMTHSSLAVGALGVAEVVPMVAGMLIGGAIADAADRRLLVLITEATAGVMVAGLAVNAACGHPRLWLFSSSPPPVGRWRGWARRPVRPPSPRWWLRTSCPRRSR